MQLIQKSDGDDRLALICRGLTGSYATPSALDELALSLSKQGISSQRFDYSGTLDPKAGQRLRTISSMRRDLSRAIMKLEASKIGSPDLVIARGVGARVALERLRRCPAVSLIMWAPILWLRTSLEIRFRTHEVRRRSCSTFDDTRIGRRFIASLRDPTDDEILSWIVPNRRHVIVYARDDQVAPARLVDEAAELIRKARGHVTLVDVPGGHPHPGRNVASQVAEITRLAERL